MSAPVRDLSAEARAALASLVGPDVVKVEDAWEWLDDLPLSRWLFVCQLLGVTGGDA